MATPEQIAAYRADQLGEVPPVAKGGAPAARPNPFKAMGVMGGMQLMAEPEPTINALSHPMQSLAALGQQLTSPSTTWRPAFEQGLVNVMQGNYTDSDLANAVWQGAGNATGVRPAFNAGRNYGDTARRGLTLDPTLGSDFRTGLNRLQRILNPVDIGR
jgi:hypothetical protein